MKMLRKPDRCSLSTRMIVRKPSKGHALISRGRRIRLHTAETLTVVFTHDNVLYHAVGGKVEIMAEESTKLFASRAERIPEATDRDIAYNAAEKLIEQIPVVGTIITIVASQFLGPSLAKRQIEWWKEMADAFEAEERKNEAFRTEHAFESESFITAVVQASRIAVSTHQHEKRILLRNALMNIATGRAPGEDMQHIYLRLIDEFTPSHVAILGFLWRAAPRLAKAHGGTLPANLSFQQVLDELEPQYQREHQLVEQILQDLLSRGLATLAKMNASYPQQVMTNSGIAFLRFVMTPEDLQ